MRSENIVCGQVQSRIDVTTNAQPVRSASSSQVFQRESILWWIRGCEMKTDVISKVEAGEIDRLGIFETKVIAPHCERVRVPMIRTSVQHGCGD
jgi:hypothetical protein